MITLDLALCHRMIGCTACVLDAFALQKGLELSRNITGPIVGQQSRTMLYQNMVQAGLVRSHLQGVLHIQGGHSVGQFESQIEARKIIQNGGQVIPTPACDLEVGEVSLPQLIHSLSGMLEGICCFDHREGRVFDQVISLQDAVNA